MELETTEVTVSSLLLIRSFLALVWIVCQSVGVVLSLSDNRPTSVGCVEVTHEHIGEVWDQSESFGLVALIPYNQTKPSKSHGGGLGFISCSVDLHLPTTKIAYIILA